MRTLISPIVLSIALPFGLLTLAGCERPADTQPAAETVETGAVATPMSLAEVLDSQPDEVKARYAHRHPQETLGFFGIEPGMTVVEALPGGGWYSKILVPVLGPEGTLIGADYPLEMYRLFNFGTEEFIARQSNWLENFTSGARAWYGDQGAAVEGFVIGSMPVTFKGTADAVLLIRALHNLARFEAQGGYLTTALQNVYDVLKPGGIVGVVQHHARDDMPDDWANGSNGYLKKGFVIDRMQAAGFEYIGDSDINANPKDQPTTSDIVWRLPPSLGTSQDNPELRAQLEAVGESNRMTLKFRKPDR